MTVLLFDDLPTRLRMLALLTCFASGMVIGVLYFRSVWWSAQLFAGGGHRLTALLLVGGRLLLVGGVLSLASRQGAMPLLTMALGILTARALTLRRLQTGQ